MADSKQEKLDDKQQVETRSPNSSQTKLEADSFDVNPKSQNKPEGTSLDGIPTYAGLYGNRLISAVTIIATTGFTLFGYDQGSLSGLISAPEFIKVFPATDPAVQGADRAALLQGFYVSIYEIGCLMGAITALLIGNYLGRRRMMQIGAIIVCLGTIISVTCMPGKQAGVQFVVSRIVTGVGVGMNTATIPTWHAEIAKSHNRGLLICIEASFIAMGTAVAYWVNYAFSSVRSSISWRIPILLQVVFAIILFFGVQYLPESPRWLVTNGRVDEAQRIIASLEPCAFDDEVARLKTQLIVDSVGKSSKLKIKDCFTGGPNQHRRRTLIGISSQIMQQIGGCNCVLYYAPVIYQSSLGFDRNASLLLGGGTVTVYAFAATISYFLIESVGRRKLFLAGSAGQSFAMLLVMACLIPRSTSVVKGSVVGLFLYLVVFAVTWLPLPWLYPAELSPTATRTNANALSTIANWLFNFLIVQITPPLLNGIREYTFLIFGVLNILFIPFIYIFYPETAGRSLEEIDILFAVGYVEKRSYVEVAKNMPILSDIEIESEHARLAAAYAGRDRA